jgi:ABC-type polysaccharide/polyol phosphate transport system ATPase subunit
MVGNAIEVVEVSKRYRLGSGRKGGSIRDAIAGSVRKVLHRGHRTGPDIWALRDVSLELEEGHSLGIVGRNGAGKSTLLKILGCITEPTTGLSRTKGRVACLLEVGTGFHPELTGRENIFLNGAILGMSRRNIQVRFEEIVGFAGVERFLDTPIKRYSSGMQLRLAFAVAAHLEPDILIVDEILAVGDFEFQKKCLQRMADVEREGRTVVFVSHDLEAITRLCPSAIWLEKGGIQDRGPAADVIDAYLASSHTEDLVGGGLIRGGPLQVHSIMISDGSGRRTRSVRRDSPFSISVDFSLEERLPGFDIALYVVNTSGVRVFDEAWSDGEPMRVQGPGRYTVALKVPPVLNVGDYRIGLWAGTAYETLVHEPVTSVFHLEGSTKRRPDRVVELSLPWELGSSQEDGAAPDRDEL